ncbi:MAG: hypothetical protein ACJ8C4_06965 [Gemmataceae bacterium]
MQNALERPIVVPEGHRVFIDVATSDADELQLHLESHNIRTAFGRRAPDVTRLQVFGIPAEDVDAILGEWEVPTA